MEVQRSYLTFRHSVSCDEGKGINNGKVKDDIERGAKEADEET